MTPAQRHRHVTGPHVRRARRARELVLVAIALACAAAACAAASCTTWWTP